VIAVTVPGELALCFPYASHRAIVGSMAWRKPHSRRRFAVDEPQIANQGVTQSRWLRPPDRG
jgi:hypothetical protein